MPLTIIGVAALLLGVKCALAKGIRCLVIKMR